LGCFICGVMMIAKWPYLFEMWESILNIVEKKGIIHLISNLGTGDMMKQSLKTILTAAILLLLLGTQTGNALAAADPWQGSFMLDYFSLAPEDTYRSRLFLTGDLSSQWKFEFYLAGVGELEPEGGYLFSFAAKSKKTNHSYRYTYNRVLEVNPENYYDTQEHFQHVLLYGWGRQIGNKRWWTTNYIALGIQEGDGAVGGFDFVAYNEGDNHSLTLELKYDDFLYDWYRNLAFKVNWSTNIKSFYYGSDLSYNLRQLPGSSAIDYRYCEYNMFIQYYFLDRRLMLKLDRGGTQNWEYPEWGYEFNQIELRFRFSKALSYQGLYRLYPNDSYFRKYTNTLIYMLNFKNRLELSATNLAVSDYSLYNAIYDADADAVRLTWVIDF
jgi:hypothetical protein